MRLYTHITRLLVLAGLVVASAVGAGWKWEHLPH